MAIDNDEDKDKAQATNSNKGTLVFLASLGVTLLLTGATGSRLLKRANPSNNVVNVRKTQSSLREMFASSSQNASQHSLRPLDFRSNPHLVEPKVASQTVEGVPAAAALASTDDPMLDAMKDAVKAFGLATFLVLGSVGVTAYAIAWRVGATDLESFMVKSRTELFTPWAGKLRPNLPDWLQQPELSSEQEQEIVKEEEDVRSWIAREGWKDSLHDSKDGATPAGTTP